MTVVALKELKKEVKKYIDEADEDTVKAMHTLLLKPKEDDWWDNLSDEQREGIDLGLKQMEEGKTIPHKEVMKQYSKWLSK